MEFFCVRARQEVVESWGGGVRRQVIGQAEIAPVVVSKLTWGDRLGGRLVIHFIDNDAVRAGLVKGYSPILASCAMVAEANLEDVRLHAASWYARVPSLSNVADWPSRFERELLKQAYPGAVEVLRPRLPKWWGSGELPWLACGSSRR